MQKDIANVITFLRIPLAILMLMAVPFSVVFWSFYLCAGLTDIIDGSVARKLHQESVFGAKLDSLADFVFAAAIAAFIIINTELPVWLWFCILVIVLLRFVSYGIGFYRYHTFAALHTYANKITGALIFMAPVLYYALGMTATGAIVCAVALTSATEEIVIIAKAEKLDRDCVSIFTREKK